MADPAEDDDRGLVLVVDDDAAVCWALEQALLGDGYRVKVVGDAQAGKRAVARSRPDLVLTDVRMPGQSGLELLAELKGKYQHLPVVVMTAHGTMETAIEAVKQGAFDYLPKPIDLNQLRSVVGAAMGERKLALAASGSREGSEEASSAIIGSTPAMQEVYRRIAAAANTDLGVLVTGPSGSGKELVARALHAHSSRSDQPFIAVNCGALPDNLVESELFGHEAGAFTDAKQQKIGRIEAADGGTLFLDEVGELPPPAQVKLLRFLEDQRFVRVGGEEELAVDVRIISATNRNLGAAMDGGGFREDLGFRLKVVTIELPALQERLDDLPALVRHFLERVSQRLGRPLSITDEVMAALRAHSWPGNVRELRHVLEEAAVLATGGVIGPEHCSIAAADFVSDERGTAALDRVLHNEFDRLANQEAGRVHEAMADLVDKTVIAAALARTGGNQLRAAELLGMNRITLKKRMDHLGIARAN